MSLIDFISEIICSSIAEGWTVFWSNIDKLAFLATVAAVIISLWQIRRESKLRIEREDKAIAQHVAAWTESSAHLHAKRPIDQYHAYEPAIIQNDSKTPIYDVVLSIVGLYGAGPSKEGENCGSEYDCRCLVVEIPPGLWGLWIPTGGSGMGVITAIEIAFRDSRGKCWIRRGNGDLVSIDKNPLDYYSVPLPPLWNTVERLLAKTN